MKYAVVKVVNGTYTIHAEGITTIENAKTIYHDVCKTLWNAQDVVTGCVIIADEKLNAVEGCREFIYHEIK